MNLGKYYEKNVEFTLVDGVTSTGFVWDYTPAIDTPDEICDEIVITGSPKFPWNLDLRADEIKEIHTIE